MHIARETAGAAHTRSSLRPLFSGGETKCKSSNASRREIAKSYSNFVGRAEPTGRANARPMTGSACPPIQVTEKMVGTAQVRLCSPYEVETCCLKFKSETHARGRRHAGSRVTRASARSACDIGLQTVNTNASRVNCQ